MKEALIFSIGVIVGLIMMYYMVRSEFGDDYKIEQLKQRNKRNKNSIIDNDINAMLEKQEPKKRIKNPKSGLFKRLKEKRQNKKK